MCVHVQMHTQQVRVASVLGAMLHVLVKTVSYMYLLKPYPLVTDTTDIGLHVVIKIWLGPTHFSGLRTI